MCVALFGVSFVLVACCLLFVVVWRLAFRCSLFVVCCLRCVVWVFGSVCGDSCLRFGCCCALCFVLFYV